MHLDHARRSLNAVWRESRRHVDDHLKSDDHVKSGVIGPAPLMTTDWAVTLGTTHGARERAGALASRAAREGTAEMVSLSLQRWTSIVAAMTQLVRAYNGGFNRDVLSVAEGRLDPNRPTVTIKFASEGGPSLLAVLEGTLICVRTSDAQGLSRETEHALRPDRNDQHTAAYVLQHWMERL